MHVYYDLFDVLDFAERNEDHSLVEAPTSTFCQRQVAHKIPSILTMHDSGYFISICMFRTY